MNNAEQVDRLESFLSQDPSNLTLISEVVHAAVRAGQTARAHAILERSRQATVVDAPLRHLGATILLAEHRYTEAKDTLHGLVRDGVDASGVIFNLGYASIQAGDPSLGVEYLHPLMSRPDAPDDTLVWLLRGRLQAAQPDQAWNDWRDAPVALRSMDAAAVASLAAFDTNRIDEARALSQAALDAGVQSLEALVVRASLALGDGDFSTAEELLRRGRELAPRDARLRFSCGLSMLLQGNHAAARDEFRFAVTHQPQHAGGWIALAWASIFVGDLSSARSSIGSAMDLDRNFAETHGLLAVVDALEGHREAARAGIQRAMRLDRSNMASHYAEAVLQGVQGDASVMRARVATLLGGSTSKPGLALLARLRSMR
jgi:Tfp pilus assembly protein PilF